ncbi:hypothetical protein AB6A40_003351 [Gnathostoma spinigerum]|uniref:Riboflavin transporter n=1 Tax=Gnathostoma spinigerum TaxID=75299 RepID=A0ABD6EJA5_9BILA
MVRLVTYILVIFFGSSSWLSTNSVWMQLPLLTDKLPEGWNLPSYLAVVVQIACVGPLVYSIFHKCCKVSLPSSPIIFTLLLFCCICTALLALFWNITIFIFGQQRSVVLFLLLFGMALVNATSNVLFMPYMSAFHPNYLTAYFVGMGVSALFPSLISIAQGSGDQCVLVNGTFIRQLTPPRFGIAEYNFIMLIWMILATISFTLIRWSPLGSEEKRKKDESLQPTLPADESSPLNQRYAEMGVEQQSSPAIFGAKYVLLLVLMMVINAQMNGIIPSIQSFATLPYSRLTYHLALTLANIFSPVACFLPLLIQPSSVYSLTLLSLISTLLTSYVVFLAAGSPNPILQASVFGKVFAVSSAVAVSALHSYLRTVITTVLQAGVENNESRLFWCGVFIQIGSFLGSAVMFPLVNILHLFRSSPVCASLS